MAALRARLDGPGAHSQQFSILDPGGCSMAQPATTRWSLIAQAADIGEAGSAAALAELCALWRPAVLGFLRRRVDESTAEDLTQGFFLHFIESEMAGKADPQRGRFRSFLYASLKRWCIDQERTLHTERRGGGQTMLDWEALNLFDPAAAPDQAFDRAWAGCMLREAMRRLRYEADCNGRMVLFEAAAPFLLEEPDPGDYARAAATVSMLPNTFAVAVGRLRKRLQKIIQDMVADTATSDAEATAELRHLRAALRAK